MKLIPLTQGKFAQVDDDMFDELNKHKWRYSDSGSGYATRSQKGKSILMHRVILDAPVGMEIDHIDGNGLNNQRSNIRICNHSENGRNRKIQTNNKIGFKGVFNNGTGWRAQIQINKTKISIGTFHTSDEAARAYDEAAKEYFGEFARLNFPE